MGFPRGDDPKVVFIRRYVTQLMKPLIIGYYIYLIEKHYEILSKILGGRS